MTKVEPEQAKSVRKRLVEIDELAYTENIRRVVMWGVLFVATCVAGSIAIYVLNGHRRVTTTTTLNPTTTSILIMSTSTPAKSVTTTASTTSALLFLSSYLQEGHRARLINELGELPTGLSLNEEEVFKSCGVTHRNKRIIFGGVVNQKQILRLDSCKVTVIGELPFNFVLGACDTRNDDIVLCFGDGSAGCRQCRNTTSPLGNWTDLKPSSFPHYLTRIATSPGGKSHPANGEFFNFETGEWKNIKDYPFSNGSYLSHYDMIFVDTLSAFFVIGGQNEHGRLGSIAKYQNDCWSDAGQLKTPRQAHSAEWINGAIVIAGGEKELSSESCSMDENGKFNCSDIMPILKSGWAATFVVDEIYCI